MAPVNPQVQPVQDPNYLFWSRPIQQFEGSKAAGIALSTTGNVIEEGAKATTNAIEEHITQGIRGEVEPLQQTFQDQLATVDPQGTKPQSVLDSPGETTPAPLSGLQKTAGTLVQARNNGRLTETDFKGRLDTIAKDYRAQYPGQAKFVDETIRNVTGFRSTANEYIQSMIGDINAAAAKKDSINTKIETQIIDHPYPGSEGILQKLQSGEMSHIEAFKWYTQIKGTENAWQYDKLSWEHAKDQREANGAQMQDKVANRANQIASMYANNMFAIVGENQKQKLFDTIGEAGIQGTPGNKLTDEQWLGLDSTITTTSFAVRRHIQDTLHETNAEGQSYASIYGEPKAKQIEDDAMRLFDQAHKAIGDKESGLAFRHLHQASAKMADFNTNILHDHDMAAIAGYNHFITTYAGPNGLKDAVGLTLLSSSVAAAVRDRFTFDRLKALSQGDPKDGIYRGSAQPTTTVNSLLDAAASDKIKDEGFNKAVAEFAPADFLDPRYKDTPIQLNAAKTLFSPENQGAILRFNKDYTENGRTVPGYMHVFNTWYSPAMTAEAARVGQTHPEVWNNYRTSAEKSFGSVFSKEINDLNSWQSFGDVTLHYDVESHHFNATLENNPTERGKEHLKPFSHNPMVLQTANEELARLNSGIDNIAQISKHVKGFDTDMYLLNTLRQRGADLSKVEDASGKVLKAISVAKYADEQPDTKGSLSSFVSNPAGILGGTKKNAPAGSSGASRGNLGDILGVQVDDIPEGMSARDFIKQLQSGN